MYKIKATGQTEKSYTKAVKIADEINSDVIEVETGLVRWQPLPAISAKKIRQYNEHLQAHEAYKRMVGK